MSDPADIARDPHAEAVDWFVRRRTASAQTAEAFRVWLEASPENALAYADVERLWTATSEVAVHSRSTSA